MSGYINGKMFFNGISTSSISLPYGYAGSAFGTAQSGITGATATVAVTDTLVLVSSSAAATACTVTLPPLASSVGQNVTIKDLGNNASTHNVTIAASSGEVIDGGFPSIAITTNMGSATLVNVGATWINTSDNT